MRYRQRIDPEPGWPELCWKLLAILAITFLVLARMWITLIPKADVDLDGSYPGAIPTEPE